jgi:hypothetical protein
VKSALFSIVLTLFKFLEATASGLYRGRSFDESVGDRAGGTWQGILCLAFLLFVLLIPFLGFTELQGPRQGQVAGTVFFIRAKSQISPPK